MTINEPKILAEVSAAFERYDRAVNDNDVEVLTESFWNSPLTVRYGIAEQLYGYEQIGQFRVSNRLQNQRRERVRVLITTFGNDFATASCEYRRRESGRIGRQMQTWIRTPDGWRVVAAHVSFLP
jgi:hypothetical protein